MASPIPRIPPVTSATCPFMSAMVCLPPMVVRCRAASAVHVLAWRVGDGRIPVAAHVRRLDQPAGPGAGPVRPVPPPGTAVLSGRGAPLLRVGGGVAGRLEPGLGPGRVDDARDVTAAR